MLLEWTYNHFSDLKLLWGFADRPLEDNACEWVLLVQIYKKISKTNTHQCCTGEYLDKILMSDNYLVNLSAKHCVYSH